MTKVIRNRFDVSTFFGFPLTLLVVSSIGCLWILVSIIQDYLAHDSLIAADIRITNLLFALRSVPGVHLFYTLTALGSPLTGVSIIVFLFVLLCLRKQWMSACVGLFGFLFAEGSTVFLKLLLHRTRPDLLLRAIVEDSYSLPSGHATTAAFVFGYGAYQFFLRYKSKKIRAVILLLVVGLVLIVDFSRVYLGVHYVSDVLAGNAIGFFFLFLTIVLDQWFQRGKNCFSKSSRESVKSVTHIMTEK